jgi:hypothetical protein
MEQEIGMATKKLSRIERRCRTRGRRPTTLMWPHRDGRTTATLAAARLHRPGEKNLALEGVDRVRGISTEWKEREKNVSGP